MKTYYYNIILAAVFILVAKPAQAQWVQANGYGGNLIKALAVSPNGAGGYNLLAGTGDGVFLSTNNGTNWTSAGLSNKSILSFIVSGTNLFAGTVNDGVFLSANNGTSWAAVNNGLFKTINGTTQYNQIHAFAVIDNNLFAGTYGGGVFLSTNNGANWTAVDSGLTDTGVWALTVKPNGSGGTDIFAGTDRSGGGVFLSTNNGTSWTAVNSGLTNPYIVTLAVSPNGSGGTDLFAGTDRFGGVFRSTNNGTSWTTVNSGSVDLYQISVWAFAVTPNGTNNANLFAGTDHGGVFLSTNYGKLDKSYMPHSISPYGLYSYRYS